MNCVHKHQCKAWNHTAGIPAAQCAGCGQEGISILTLRDKCQNHSDFHGLTAASLWT